MGWQGKGNTSRDYAVYEKLNRVRFLRFGTPHGYWFVQAAEVKAAVNRTVEQAQNEIASEIWLEKQQSDRARAVAREVLARANAGESLLLSPKVKGPRLIPSVQRVKSGPIGPSGNNCQPLVAAPNSRQRLRT